ncbi:MAG TPA: hypothetical protein P5072_16475 [Parvularculaceae bacterium]|nr:hypothetical protein [Parvularculaceae bacterium]
MHAYIWSYRVKPEWREKFQRAYGPNGEWAVFFARSPGYVRTDLLSDEREELCFVTIDYFKDEHVRGLLVEAHKDEYAAIDKRWQDATVEETYIGAFRVDSKE